MPNLHQRPDAAALTALQQMQRSNSFHVDDLCASDVDNKTLRSALIDLGLRASVVLKDLDSAQAVDQPPPSVAAESARTDLVTPLLAVIQGGRRDV